MDQNISACFSSGNAWLQILSETKFVAAENSFSDAVKANNVAKTNNCSVIADHWLQDKCTVSRVPRLQYAVIFTLQ